MPIVDFRMKKIRNEELRLSVVSLGQLSQILLFPSSIRKSTIGNRQSAPPQAAAKRIENRK